MKRISIAIVLMAVFAGGCTLTDTLADWAGRLSGIPDHLQLQSVDDDNWVHVQLDLVIAENPFDAGL